MSKKVAQKVLFKINQIFIVNHMSLSIIQGVVAIFKSITYIESPKKSFSKCPVVPENGLQIWCTYS